MNGKLAKQIRKAVSFNPNTAREYRLTNVGGWFLYPTYTAVATGHRAAYQTLKRWIKTRICKGKHRAAYQTLKASVLGAKRGGR